MSDLCVRDIYYCSVKKEKMVSIFLELLIGILACAGYSIFRIYGARGSVCDGIEVNSGRHLFKGKKKNNKKYPKRVRTFFLIDYLKYVDRGQYIVFLTSIVIGFLLCCLVFLAVIKGTSSILVEIFVALFLVEYILSGWVIDLIGPRKKK